METSTLCGLAGPHGGINPGSRSRWNSGSPVFCLLEMWTVYNAAWIDKSKMYKKGFDCIKCHFLLLECPNNAREDQYIWPKNIIHKLHLNSSTRCLRLSPPLALTQKLTADWQWGTSSDWWERSWLLIHLLSSSSLLGTWRSTWRRSLV